MKHSSANAALSEMPQIPEVPKTPETPKMPQTPKMPETPEKPQTPKMPETSEKPQTPKMPKTPEASEKPEMLQTPEVPETPKMSDEKKTRHTQGAQKSKRKARCVFPAVATALALLCTCTFFILSYCGQATVPFDPAGAAGVTSYVTVEAISPITKADDAYYLFYINQSEDTLGIIKASPQAYAQLQNGVSQYAGADAEYDTAMRITGVSVPFPDSFIRACIESGLADSEDDSQFRSLYGSTCLEVAEEGTSIWQHLFRLSLFLLLPVCFLWLMFALLWGRKRRLNADAADNTGMHTKSPADSEELTDDF